MSINLSMATTWQSDIRYHSGLQWRSHIYIVAKHVVFLVFVFGNERNWTRKSCWELGDVMSTLHTLLPKMSSWHPKISHIARLDLIGSLDAYHVLCRSRSNLQSRWDMAEMFQGLLPFWMSSRLADEWISGFGWIGFLLASVNKGSIKWQERTQKCLLWYTISTEVSAEPNVAFMLLHFLKISAPVPSLILCVQGTKEPPTPPTNPAGRCGSDVPEQWGVPGAAEDEISVKTIIECGIKMW